MKWIKYQVVQDTIDGEVILLTKKIEHSEANLAIANTEAYDGYEIIEDEKSFEEKPLSIELGGTGGKTAEEARKNLGAAITASYRAVISEDGWSDSVPYAQTIIVDGLLASDEPFVDIDFSIVESAGDALYILENWQNIGRLTVSADNTLTAYCYEEKAVCNIPIILKVVR